MSLNQKWGLARHDSVPVPIFDSGSMQKVAA
jgi:hypothetical protein